MLDFSFAKGNEELQERAPLFYSVLVAGGSNKKTEKKKLVDSSSWNGCFNPAQKPITMYECCAVDVEDTIPIGL